MDVPPAGAARQGLPEGEVEAHRSEARAGFRPRQPAKGRHRVSHRGRRLRDDGVLHPVELHGLRLGRGGRWHLAAEPRRRPSCSSRATPTASARASARTRPSFPASSRKGGRPVMSFGVMGGTMQPQGHAQVMVRIADYGQSPQAACDGPRFRFVQGMDVSVEDGASPRPRWRSCSAAATASSPSTTTTSSAARSSSGSSTAATSPPAIRAATGRQWVSRPRSAISANDFWILKAHGGSRQQVTIEGIKLWDARFEIPPRIFHAPCSVICSARLSPRRSSQRCSKQNPEKKRTETASHVITPLAPVQTGPAEWSPAFRK